LTKQLHKSTSEQEDSRAPTREDPLRAKPLVKEASRFLGLDLENEAEDELPDDCEDVGSILAEMEALKAVFDAIFQGSPSDRAKACVRQALAMQESDPVSFEGKLTVFCLSWILGEDRIDILPKAPSGNKWTKRTFEELALGWVAWIREGSTQVLETINKMHLTEPEEDDGSIETLSLNFWAKALELLVKGRGDESRRFFDRANNIGSQFGTSTNPSICWTYAVSFFTKRPHP